MSRRRARIAQLAGATALACALAALALPGMAAAQGVDIDRSDISPDAELLLEADTLVYDNDRNTITAEGGVQIDYDGH
jgi:LPS-assembly protein